AIRTVDDQNNWSGLSNVVGKTAPAPTVESSRFPLAMSAPFPNRARNAVALLLSLPEASDVVVEVMDLFGRRVKTLVYGPMPAGESPVRLTLQSLWGALDS